MTINKIYDIIFIGLIITLIILYVIFSEKDNYNIKVVEVIDPDDINVDNIIRDNTKNDVIDNEYIQQEQETNDVLFLEGDAYKYIDKSDLPWDDNILCENEEELDSLHAFMLNNLHSRKRVHVMY
jgi:hypothetical protein